MSVMKDSHRSLPAGPRWPAALQAASWVFRPISFLTTCSRRYGSVFTLRLPAYPPLVFVSDPEAIRRIFAGDPAVLHAGDANRVLRPIMGPNSLLLLDGRRHRRERKLLMPLFHGERMRAYGELMRSATERYVSEWPVGRPFAVHPELQKMTLDLILRAVIGIDDPGRHDVLRKRLI